MGFSKQESWSGLPFLSPGDLSHPGIEPRSPALQEDSLASEPPRKLILYKRIKSTHSDLEFAKLFLMELFHFMTWV